jgi:hypothetical protein
MYLQFNSKIVSKSSLSEVLSTSDTNGELLINFGFTTDENDFYHTLILYDQDTPAPYPKNKSSPFIHYLVYNIPGADLNKGITAIDYISPNPPISSPPHTYYVNVYRQMNFVESIPQLNRENFPVNEFVRSNQLDLINQLKFKVSHNIKGNTGKGIHHDTIMKKDADITEDEKKFCSCTLEVEAKKEAGHSKIINPYAICSKSVGTSVGRSEKCGKNYNFDEMPDELIQAYMHLKKMNIPEPWNRGVALNLIYKKLEGIY